jgi:hypothetical protein
MQKELHITVPNNWSAVTLEKYLILQKDIKLYEGEPEAYIACLFHHLCAVSPEVISKIDLDTFNSIKNDLVGFMRNNDCALQRHITIDGVEYGFEPNLSKMSYGAYLDITKLETFTIDDNWSKIMAILYRPVTQKNGNLYSIKPYTGKEDSAIFDKVTMDVHFGALFFFVHLSKDLVSSTLKYLKDSETLPPSIKSILERSGETIHQ